MRIYIANKASEMPLIAATASLILSSQSYRVGCILWGMEVENWGNKRIFVVGIRVPLAVAWLN